MRLVFQAGRCGWPMVALLGSMGCADDSSSADTTTGAGGASTKGCSDTLELRVAEFIEEDQPLALLQSGDALHLWNAPQGGHVVTVGAEVRGLTTDLVRIEARLLDSESEQVVQDDTRSIVVKPIEGEPDWMSPDIRSRNQVAHIALCPDTERRTLLERDLILEVEIQETKTDCGGVGVARVPVTLECQQADAGQRAFCECQCSEDYEPGNCE